MSADFVKAHWRLALEAALVLAAVAVGRYSAPKPTVKVVTQEHVVTKTVVAQAEAKETVKNQVIYRDRVVYRDGTVEEKSETRTVSDTTDKKTENVVSVGQTDTKTGVETKTVRSDWRVSVLAGAPVLKPEILVGVGVERRLAGPVYVGVWAFNPTTRINPTAGISLGVAF